MVSARNPFQAVRDLRPGRSTFDLSYSKKFSADMGLLYPVMCDEVVPGDQFKIGNQVVIRFQPLVAPLMHEVNAFVHYFFVSYRHLTDSEEDWEDFIVGGADGETSVTLPTWNPTNTDKKSLWDFFGFPVGVVPSSSFLPLDFPRRAYNFVWNEYYRNQNVQQPVALTNESILRRNWSKDFFTSSLPWQQRGTAPALPVTGFTSAVWDPSVVVGSATIGNAIGVYTTAGDNRFVTPGAVAGPANILGALNDNIVDLSSATTFNISDLRLTSAIQRFMEISARGGARYTEYLTTVFGLKAQDSRLQRPEYIGGSRTPIIISEVLQTSSTDETSAQGNLAGHGISADSSFCGSYFAKEHGLIIGLLSIMPVPAYAAQGIPRQWLRRTPYDFYHPAFANLSERGTLRGELYATTSEEDNNQIFGFQGIWDELRTKSDMIVSDLRDDFEFWHLARKFSTTPSEPDTSAPLLNSAFVQCNPRKDIFAVPSEDGMIVTFGNLIRAVRPLPIQSNPGLMDHVWG